MKIIGIDPAFRENGIGFAELDTETRHITFEKYSVNQLIGKIYKREFINSIVIVENSNLQNTSFDLRGTKSVVARKSRNVGCNQATSQIIFDALQFQCHKRIELSPKDKGAKFLKDDLVKGIAKTREWELSKNNLNQDDRDAFKLVEIAYNRYLREIKTQHGKKNRTTSNRNP